MKFLYQYRTSDNVRHDGVIKAASREAAFTALKARGIRPGCVVEAPGFFNKLFGKGKRWMAIAVLAIVVALLIWAQKGAVGSVGHTGDSSISGDAAERAGVLDRRQLLGDASVIAHGVESNWSNVFVRASDRFLSEFAQPGAAVRRLPEDKLNSIISELATTHGEVPVVDASELEEIQQIKKIVAGIRNELSEYVSDGGTVAAYVECLYQRQSYENTLRHQAKLVLDRARNQKTQQDYTAEWKRVNTELRAFGLALIPLDE